MTKISSTYRKFNKNYTYTYIKLIIKNPKKETEADV